MIGLFVAGLLWAQTPVHSADVIWREIASLEAFINDTVKENDSNFMTTNSDPVRGYYIERQGVFLLVPVRYVPNMGVAAQPGKAEQKEVEGNLGSASFKVDRIDIQKRYDEWKARMRKNELAKQANFDRAVTNLKNAIPQVLEILASLPKDESLTLVVEERVAWYYPGFSLERSPTIKVVTLTVDKLMISEVAQDQTILKKDWQKQIQSKTTNRVFYSFVP